jgi:hypothetical protein
MVFVAKEMQMLKVFVAYGSNMSPATVGRLPYIVSQALHPCMNHRQSAMSPVTDAAETSDSLIDQLDRSAL